MENNSSNNMDECDHVLRYLSLVKEKKEKVLNVKTGVCLNCCLLLLNNITFSTAAVRYVSVLKMRLFLLLNSGT